MNKDKILLTGCAGFIGSHLGEHLLAEGHELIGIDNLDPFYDPSIKKDNLLTLKAYPNFHFFEGDIRDQALLDQIFEEHPVGTVFHLAAKAGVRPSLEDPPGYIDVNIRGTERILSAMQRHGTHDLIFASSSSVYGETPGNVFREDQPLNKPISVYAATKLACEQLIHTYHHLYGLSTVNLRYFTVYGPRQRPDLAIHKFSKAILNETPIQVYGDGSSKRDYTYVKDIVEGTHQAYQYLKQNDPLYEIINLGNSQPVQLEELIAALEGALNKKAKREYTETQPGDVSHTYASIEKAQRLLGYDPKTPLSEGLEAFSSWVGSAAPSS